MVVPQFNLIPFKLINSSTLRNLASSLALNLTAFLASIFKGSPVLGFLPTLSAPFTTSNEPNPTSFTASPFFTASVWFCYSLN